MFKCSVCGYQTITWLGKCPNCNNFNSLEKIEQIKNPISLKSKEVAFPSKLSDIKIQKNLREKTCFTEFNRVLGGGLTKASANLFAGEPGVGKSTILMQVLSSLQNQNILYFSGEETLSQIKQRCGLLKINNNNIYLSQENNIENIFYFIEQVNPQIVIIDSLQTLSTPDGLISPSSNYLKESLLQLIEKCKQKNITIFIVAHITKDKSIAGPKFIEHMVDCVLFMEKLNFNIKILRCLKNRYGPSNEICFFQQENIFFKEINQPENFLVNINNTPETGKALSSTIAGSRPVLIEIQSLCASAVYGNVRRNSTGFDYNRLNMLLAVLEKKAGLFVGNQDVFLNIAGGMKINDTTIDLGVCASLISSLLDIPLKSDTLFLGEVSLTGNLILGSNIDVHLKNIIKFPIKKIVMPASSKKLVDFFDKINIINIINISELKDLIKKDGG